MKIGTVIIENPCERSDFVDEGFDYFINAFGPHIDDGYYHCPCCGYPTLSARGSFGLCTICYWEDDGQDSHDADRVRGGPNGNLSLYMAQQNFRTFSACDAQFMAQVRPPSEEEKRYRKYDC